LFNNYFLVKFGVSPYGHTDQGCATKVLLLLARLKKLCIKKCV